MTVDPIMVSIRRSDNPWNDDVQTYDSTFGINSLYTPCATVDVIPTQVPEYPPPTEAGMGGILIVGLAIGALIMMSKK